MNEKEFARKCFQHSFILMFFGILLNFNTVIIFVANFLTLFSSCIIIGSEKVSKYLFSSKHILGTITFFYGIFFIFFSFPRIGIVFEVGGLYLLFGGKNGIKRKLARRIPMIRNLYPEVSSSSVTTPKSS